MPEVQTKTDIGYIVGASFTVLFILIGLALLLWGVAMWREGGWDRDGAWLPLGGGVVCILAAAGLFIGAAWPPFNMEYHSYRQVTGQVAEVQARMLAEDHGTTQNYALLLAGTDAIYRCDDTRCSLLKPGDRIWLWCIREWQQAATPGYDCNYDHVVRGGAS